MVLETNTSVLKLIIEDDEGRKTVVPFVRDEMTIGRQEGNTIRLTERNVSRRHARLMRQNGHVLIEDLGSYNGIRVNGDRIKGQVAIKDGDLVQIGDYDLAVQQELADAMANSTTIPLAAAPQRASGSQRTVASRPDSAATLPLMPTAEGPDASSSTSATMVDAKVQSTAVIRADQVQGKPRVVTDIDPAEAPRLVVLNTEHVGREFLCVRTELRIGRTDDNDFALDHRSLSRTHVKVVREDNGEWRVIDMQSANGLLVNGEPYAQVTLRSGDVLELGHVKLRFVGSGEAFTPPPQAETTEVPMPRPSRTGPMLGGLVALAVIVVGVGGYAIYKRLYVPEAGPSTKSTPPIARTPEAASRSPEALLADGEEAIAALDWLKAEALLKQSKLGRSQELLQALEEERPYRQALLQAREALAKGNHAEAARQLDAAGDTKLLKAQWEELDQKRAELVKKTLGSKVPQVSAEATPHLEAGRKLMEDRQWRQAIAPLSKCVKLDPRAYECFALLGSAYSRENDTDRGLEWYRRFLREAPHDHPRYAGVAKRIADYEEQMRARTRDR